VPVEVVHRRLPAEPALDGEARRGRHIDVQRRRRSHGDVVIHPVKRTADEGALMAWEPANRQTMAAWIIRFLLADVEHEVMRVVAWIMRVIVEFEWAWRWFVKLSAKGLASALSARSASTLMAWGAALEVGQARDAVAQGRPRGGGPPRCVRPG